MIETAVVFGEGSADKDFTAGWATESAVMVAAVGLMGVTGRDCARYHSKTSKVVSTGWASRVRSEGVAGRWNERPGGGHTLVSKLGWIV